MKTFWAKEAGAATASSKKPNNKPGNFMQALILASDIGESMMSFMEGHENRWSELVVAGTCVAGFSPNETKKGQGELLGRFFFAVKIVNGRTCKGKVVPAVAGVLGPQAERRGGKMSKAKEAPSSKMRV